MIVACNPLSGEVIGDERGVFGVRVMYDTSANPVVTQVWEVPRRSVYVRHLHGNVRCSHEYARIPGIKTEEAGRTRSEALQEVQ